MHRQGEASCRAQRAAFSVSARDGPRGAGRSPGAFSTPLAGRPEHVLVLTETEASAGCRLLASAFTTVGCHVTFPVSGPGEYGVMIIGRVQAQPDGFGSTVSYLPTRAASVTLPAPAGPIQVIGAYTITQH